MQGPKSGGAVAPELAAKLKRLDLRAEVKGPYHLPWSRAERYFLLTHLEKRDTI
jgi:hypothetical protein